MAPIAFIYTLFRINTHFRHPAQLAQRGPNSAPPNIDHSRGKLVGTIYDLDGGWYTSKPSNRLVKEIYEFWANLSCPDDSTAQPLAGSESEDMAKP